MRTSAWRVLGSEWSRRTLQHDVGVEVSAGGPTRRFGVQVYELAGPAQGPSQAYGRPSTAGSPLHLDMGTVEANSFRLEYQRALVGALTPRHGREEDEGRPFS